MLEFDSPISIGLTGRREAGVEGLFVVFRKQDVQGSILIDHDPHKLGTNDSQDLISLLNDLTSNASSALNSLVG